MSTAVHTSLTARERPRLRVVTPDEPVATGSERTESTGLRRADSLSFSGLLREVLGEYRTDETVLPRIDTVIDTDPR